MKLTVMMLVFASACVKSNAVVCEGDRLCPEGTACDETHLLCVAPDQITACDGKGNRDACTYASGSGNCHEGVCLPGICGDGIVDGLETCDDGNLLAGDGCSADCQSLETCGNGTIDLVKGEQCDDTNIVDHDGCSSACKTETAQFLPLADPGPRAFAVAAYDPARDKVVMFGGSPFAQGGNPIAMKNITSEWDGVWQNNIRTTPPPIRTGAAMAYGPNHHVVLFGGLQSEIVGDTWEWDGVSWRRLADGPKLFHHAMAFDAKRKRIVVFGGFLDAGGNVSDETYEFDGATWTKMSPAARPAGTGECSMVYDPERNVVVLYRGEATLNDETWEYDGQTWTNRHVHFPTPQNGVTHPTLAYSSKMHRVVIYGGGAGGGGGGNIMYAWDGTTWTIVTAAGATPSFREDHVFVDNGRGDLLLFGGLVSDSQQPLQDTWLFDGTAWTNVSANPYPRQDAAVARSSSKVVVFGGRNGAAFPSDTWELTKRGWKQFTGGTTPPGTDFPQMVYDEAHDKFVMFGGAVNGTTPDNTTWVRTGSTWSSSHPVPSPSARALFGLAYDAARGNTVLFGGVDATNTRSAETWTFDGTNWTLRTPAHSPDLRAFPAMAYDRTNRVVVLFGGSNATKNFNDTWVWDGTDWTQITPAGVPPPTYVFTGNMVWDAPSRSILMMGGAIALTQTDFEIWKWTGTGTPGGWDQVVILDHPSDRGFAALYPTFQGDAIVVGGGGATSGPAATLSDQFLYRVSGPAPSDSCHIDIDLDGDGKTRCDDPDCWATCTPDCPPGASCPGTAPRCGDGSCGAAESCHTCPQDCTSCPNLCGDFVCDPGESCPGDC